jgi:hypothetical protein
MRTPCLQGKSSDVGNLVTIEKTTCEKTKNAINECVILLLLTTAVAKRHQSAKKVF